MNERLAPIQTQIQSTLYQGRETNSTNTPLDFTLSDPKSKKRPTFQSLSSIYFAKTPQSRNVEEARTQTRIKHTQHEPKQKKKRHKFKIHQNQKKLPRRNANAAELLPPSNYLQHRCILNSPLIPSEPIQHCKIKPSQRIKPNSDLREEQLNKQKEKLEEDQIK